MTEENYLKKLADMQTQIKELVPDSLKENVERRMTDTFEFTLNNPLTEEQWDMIADVDMERTDRITFQTKHGKEVEFSKVRHGKWIDGHCSLCGCDAPAYIEDWKWIKDMNAKYCPMCGARMDEE
jgi:hypothetical protein